MDHIKLHSWELVHRLTLGIETVDEPWPDIMDDSHTEDMDEEDGNGYRDEVEEVHQEDMADSPCDSDQYHPVWPYVADKLECDCSPYRLSEFLAHVRAHPDAIDPGDLKDIFELWRMT